MKMTTNLHASSGQDRTPEDPINRGALSQHETMGPTFTTRSGNVFRRSAIQDEGRKHRSLSARICPYPHRHRRRLPASFSYDTKQIPLDDSQQHTRPRSPNQHFSWRSLQQQIRVNVHTHPSIQVAFRPKGPRCFAKRPRFLLSLFPFPSSRSSSAVPPPLFVFASLHLRCLGAGSPLMLGERRRSRVGEK